MIFTACVFGFLVRAIALYLLIVELGKKRFHRVERTGPRGGPPPAACTPGRVTDVVVVGVGR